MRLKCSATPSFILLMCTKCILLTFTKFHQFYPSFTFSYQLLTCFYQLLPPSTIFHRFLLSSIKFYQFLYHFSSIFMLLMFFQILPSSVVTHVINMITVFKVISSDNLLSVSFNILISSYFLMPIMSLILCNTLYTVESSTIKKKFFFVFFSFSH